VAGAILGAHWGESLIPERWRKAVRNSAEIIQLADDLIEACRPSGAQPVRRGESLQACITPDKPEKEGALHG
jgi:hypothetical protein